MNDTLVTNTAWHARPAQEVLDLLQTSREGIATPEAEKRLRQSGPNVLAEARPESVFRIVLRQLRSPLIYVLLAATVLAVAMGKTTDGLVVLGVVALNTLIGVIQEYQAGQAIQGLLRMIPDSATVWRDGIQRSIPSAQLVA
ncbi:MAG: cation-transporting P-type ATPase, partial [Cytophagales bacterium]|nr:cation-transporting P-type ATPase [Cytophagales bacterium]